MSKSIFRSFLIGCLSIWMATSVIGCGSKVSGKYADPTGTMSADFKSGKVSLAMGGQPVEEDDYTVDGDKVTVKNKNGENVVFTIASDGSLQGPMGMVLKKTN
jgi:hypothetical protein